MTRATDDDPETWWVCLRPEGDGPPMPIRMRRFLKAALRSYRLRCVRVSGKAPIVGNGSHDQHMTDVHESHDGVGHPILGACPSEPHG